jgi:DNA-binding transcriptional ArsR family regulator
VPIYYGASLDRTFHALGDGTRRGMLALLVERGECSAGELGEPFEISQPSASQHLRVLESAGLLERRVEGRAHRFRLIPQPLAEAQQWIERHRALWRGSLDRLGSVIEDARKGRGHGA